MVGSPLKKQRASLSNIDEQLIGKIGKGLGIDQLLAKPPTAEPEEEPKVEMEEEL